MVLAGSSAALRSLRYSFSCERQSPGLFCARKFPQNNRPPDGARGLNPPELHPMSTAPADSAKAPAVAHCPVCGEPNHCRLETGEPYKGPCWCERPVLTSAVLRRLLGELLEPRCLCPSCLEFVAANPEVTWDELVAGNRLPDTLQLKPGEFYMEDGCTVFTAPYHLRRGYCCGSRCRHCPFGVVENQVSP